MSKNPAEILHFDYKGEIKEGNDADIVIINVDNEHVIEPSEFYSKAKFTPAKGLTVSGETLHCFESKKKVF